MDFRSLVQLHLESNCVVSILKCPSAMRRHRPAIYCYVDLSSLQSLMKKGPISASSFNLKCGFKGRTGLSHSGGADGSSCILSQERQDHVSNIELTPNTNLCGRELRHGMVEEAMAAWPWQMCSMCICDLHELMCSCLYILEVPYLGSLFSEFQEDPKNRSPNSGL